MKKFSIDLYRGNIILNTFQTILLSLHVAFLDCVSLWQELSLKTLSMEDAVRKAN